MKPILGGIFDRKTSVCVVTANYGSTVFNSLVYESSGSRWLLLTETICPLTNSKGVNQRNFACYQLDIPGDLFMVLQSWHRPDYEVEILIPEMLTEELINIIK